MYHHGSVFFVVFTLSTKTLMSPRYSNVHKYPWVNYTICIKQLQIHNIQSRQPWICKLLSPTIILHFYHHLFAELVHLYNLPLYWVCWGHKRLFVIWLQGCLRERPSSSYASYGLINLRSSTRGKFATVLQTCALVGPTTSTRRRLCSRHQ